MRKTKSSKLQGKIALLSVAMTAVSINCGRSNGKRSSADDHNDLIPAGWDGKSDWKSGRWSVTDLAQSAFSARGLDGVIGTPSRQPADNRRCVVSDTVSPEGDTGFVVRMKFFQGGALHSALAGDRRIRQMTLRPSPAISELTIELSSLRELEELALKSHGHAAGCTGVEVVSAPGMLLCNLDPRGNTISVTPPVYDETIKLSAVESLLSGVVPANIVAGMTTLQGLGSRYYNGSQALAASNSVENIMTSAYTGTQWAGHAITTQVSHAGFTQRSVITSLPGSEDDDTIVVIGSHLDSIHPGNQTDAPGADDNASGVAVMAEVMRVLAASNTRFKRRVEWHAYGIEEIGLIGSGQIAASYATTGKKVAAMLQLDMASYAPESGNETIHLFPDDTTTGLRRSVKDLLTAYLGGNFTDRGGKIAGTSDHRSWYRAGYPAVFPFEDTLNYNRKMHTSEDTVANANSPALAARMTKLVMAFIAHHAGITGAESDYEEKLAAASMESDIKLAVMDADEIPEGSWPEGLTSSGTVTIFSGPESLATVESCGATRGSGRACATDRAVGIKIDNAPPGRSFFYIVSSATPDTSPARSFGYGAENAPAHLRSVTITRK